jgi:hypothetical protein
LVSSFLRGDPLGEVKLQLLKGRYMGLPCGGQDTGGQLLGGGFLYGGGFRGRGFLYRGGLLLGRLPFQQFLFLLHRDTSIKTEGQRLSTCRRPWAV